jgi:hypothetical protein
LIPKFASEVAAIASELRNRSTSGRGDLSCRARVFAPSVEQ